MIQLQTISKSVLLLSVLTIGATLFLKKRAFPSELNEAISTRSIVGDTLPSVELLRLDGTVVEMKELVADDAALLIIMGVTDCLGCSNFPLERRVINQSFPDLTVWMIGSGRGQDTFRDYFRTERSDRHALLDPSQSLLSALGIDSEPAVILLDDDGRIVLFDDRTGSQASTFRISQMLQSLSAIL